MVEKNYFYKTITCKTINNKRYATHEANVMIYGNVLSLNAIHVNSLTAFDKLFGQP